MDSGTYCTWGGVASTGMSLLMYFLARHEGKKAKALEAAHPIDSMSEAAKISRILPVLIAMRGTTMSDDPVYAEISGTPAVLAEVTEELSALKQNDKGDWLPDAQLIRKQTWETSWFLTDHTKTRVHVENSMTADLLRGAMMVTAQEYQDGNRSVYSKLVDRLAGYRPLGVRKTERVLPLESVVTVVGELAATSQDDQKKFVIRRPQDSSGPFYITRQTLEELRTSLSQVASTCKWLALGFGVLGLALLGAQAVKKIKDHMHYCNIRKQIEEEERLRRQRHLNSSGTLQQEATEEAGPGLCIVCWTNRANAVFIPCGHLCICLTCSARGSLHRCPICRKHCTVHRVYHG